MRNWTLLAAFSLLLLLPGRAFAWVEANLGPNPFASYKGEDAGRVIVSSTEIAFALLIRKIDSDETGWIWAPASRGLTIFGHDFKDRAKFETPAALRSQNLEYSANYEGSVSTATLPPGSYEIYAIITSDGSAEFDYDRISIRFDINPHRATYIGGFRGIMICGKGFFARCMSQQLVLEEKGDRDLPIAKKLWPEIGEVDVQVTPSNALGPVGGIRRMPLGVQFY